MADGLEVAVAAVQNLSASIRALRAAGVIRSRRFTGDLGEWYVECLYQVRRTSRQTQKGWVSSDDQNFH